MNREPRLEQLLDTNRKLKLKINCERFLNKFK